EVGAQSPRGVGIADTKREVRHVAEQTSFVYERAARIDRRTVDGDTNGAKCEQLQTCCGDSDIGVQMLAGLQANPSFGERFDLVGDDRSFSRSDGLKEIRVGHEAKPLIPRLIARIEVPVYVEALRKVLQCALAEQISHEIRRTAAELEDSEAHQNVLPTHKSMLGTFAEKPVQ